MPIRFPKYFIATRLHRFLHTRVLSAWGYCVEFVEPALDDERLLDGLLCEIVTTSVQIVTVMSLLPASSEILDRRS